MLACFDEHKQQDFTATESEFDHFEMGLGQTLFQLGSLFVIRCGAWELAEQRLEPEVKRLLLAIQN